MTKPDRPIYRLSPALLGVQLSSREAGGVRGRPELAYCLLRLFQYRNLLHPKFSGAEVDSSRLHRGHGCPRT